MRYQEQIEVHSVITPDGQTFNLNDGYNKAVMAIGGRAVPAIEFITRQPIDLHGEQVIDFRYQARVISLRFYEYSGDDARVKYWAARQRLIDYLRATRGGALTLRHTDEDGNSYDIEAWAQDGPFFGDEQSDIDEELSFYCPRPFFTDADTQLVQLTPLSNQEWSIPGSIPMSVGSANNVGYLSIAYTGDAPAWPKFTVEGGFSELTLRNNTTGARITITGIERDDGLIIDTNPAAPYIIAADGRNFWKKLLLPESDLSLFNIRPAGQPWLDNAYGGVTDGVNVIVAEAINDVLSSGGSFFVRIEYKRTYIGVGGPVT